MKSVACAPLTLLCLASIVSGDDWPQWLGPRRDAVWNEIGILSSFPEKGLTSLWRTPIAAGFSGPAVANGRVFVTDRVVSASRPNKKAGSERILCLNSADGRVLWKYEYDCEYAIDYPLGPRTTPVVTGANVYTLGAEGNLLCLDAKTGDVRWSHDLKKEYDTKSPTWGYAAHPLVDGQRLICMVGGKGSAVVSFDKDTGKELWRSLTCQQLGYCPPMIYEAGGKRQLIVWHGEAVNSLDIETGRLYWSHPIDTYMGMAIATPRKLGDLLFVSPPYNPPHMFRLMADKPGATLVWKGDSKAVRKPNAIGFDSCFGTPFAEAGHVYGSSAYGELICIRADTGERLWSTLEPNNGNKRQSSDIFIVKNGDRFFLYTEQGDLTIAKMTPNGYEQVSRTHLLDPTYATHGREVLWSHPAFANRCIYLRNDKEIICVSLAASAACREPAVRGDSLSPQRAKEVRRAGPSSNAK
jgi:outer membrane protein assembly factor BamB